MATISKVQLIYTLLKVQKYKYLKQNQNILKLLILFFNEKFSSANCFAVNIWYFKIFFGFSSNGTKKTLWMTYEDEREN